MQWTKDKTINLIEMYRQHNNLWDTKSIDYKNRFKKQDSLKEISDIFQTSREEVDRKIKNLISQYNRERRKYKQMKKSGTVQSFISKWFGYEAMIFLHDKKKPRKGRQGGLNLDAEDGNSSSDNSLNALNLHHESTRTKPEMPSWTPLEATAEKGEHSFTVPKPIPKKSKPTATNRRQAAFEMVKSVYDSRNRKENSTRDDFDVFGELVSRKVRSLKTTYAKATVQHLINNVLYDAEVGVYDKPMHTLRYGPSESSSGASSLNSVMSAEQLVHHAQILKCMTTPLTSIGKPSPNSAEEVQPRQIGNEPLTWAAVNAFGLNPEEE